MLLLFLLLALVPFLSHANDNGEKSSQENGEYLLRQMLRLRQHSIKRFAESKYPIFPLVAENNQSTSSESKIGGGRLQCPGDRFLVLKGGAYGRTGNNMIEFTHSLWVAEQLKSTLIIPTWMKDVFTPFNMNTINGLFCFAMDITPPAGSTTFDLYSDDSFFLAENYNQLSFAKLLPPLHSNTTISSLSRHFLHVYASLWCCPHRRNLHAAEQLLYHHLDGKFQYNSVHKRQLEGGCSSILNENTKVHDFSPAELPMYHDEWKQNLKQNHPLCTMTHSFVQETLRMHKRNGSKLFVAYDGRGGVGEFEKSNAVFSSVLQKGKNPISDVDFKFLDMFISIHSDFFIMNPRSTFSLQIYLIRVILALQSVPLLKNNDFYLQRVPEDLIAKKRPLWVSWYSVVDTILVDYR